KSGFLTIDDLTMNLFIKPCYCGEAFHNRKYKYFLGCHAVILPYNLLIVNYSLGYSGSVHDAFYL
ncbi:hypothetical protein BDR04DRAFT_1033710, partial [Suillus decipiens]